MAAAVYFFHSYITLSLSHLLALVVLPVLLVKSDNEKIHAVSVGTACIFLVVGGFLGLKSVLFIGFVCSVVSLLPLFGYRGGFLFFTAILLFSPIWYWFDLNISFNLRLMLTDMAGYILKSTDSSYQIDGNWIKTPHDEFAVEKACAGLNMLKYALLVGLLMLAIRAKQTKKIWRNSAVFTFLAVIFLLSLLSNLMRILFLVIIPLPPDSLGHEAIGLLYLLTVVLLPSYLLIWKFPFLFLKEYNNEAQVTKAKTPILLPIILCVIFISSGFATLSHKNDVIYTNELQQRWADYAYEGTVNGVHKFTKPGFLVWVKPLEDFYSAEHSPLGCWRGSGYTFEEAKLGEIHGEFYPRGQLRSETGNLHTAWWFESQNHITGDAFSWRKEALLHGEKFYLVNVTATDHGELEKEITDLWNLN